MSIRLYDLAGAQDDRRFSPYCWRVKMALVHKVIDSWNIALYLDSTSWTGLLERLTTQPLRW